MAKTSKLSGKKAKKSVIFHMNVLEVCRQGGRALGKAENGKIYLAVYIDSVAQPPN